MTFYDVYDVIADALTDEVQQQLSNNGIERNDDEIITAEINKHLFKIAELINEYFDEVEAEEPVDDDGIAADYAWDDYKERMWMR